MKMQGQRKEYQDKEEEVLSGSDIRHSHPDCPCSVLLHTPQGRLGSPKLLGSIQLSPGSFHKAGKRMSYSEAARHCGKLRNRNQQGSIILVKYLKHL